MEALSLAGSHAVTVHAVAPALGPEPSITSHGRLEAAVATPIVAAKLAPNKPVEAPGAEHDAYVHQVLQGTDHRDLVTHADEAPAKGHGGSGTSVPTC